MTTYARKSCRQCGEVKALRGFYRHPSYADGHMNTCKACKIAEVAENRELKAEQYRETKRRWAARPENVAKRKAYAQTERGREVHRAVCRRYFRLRKLFEVRA